MEVKNTHSTCTKLLDLRLILASHMRILKTADLREKKNHLPFEAENGPFTN